MRRSISSCYSDHAVKVSDSYCSRNGRATTVSTPSTTSQSSVTCVYRKRLEGQTNPLFVAVTWYHRMTGKVPVVTIASEGVEESWQLKKTKGRIMNGFRERGVEVLWDLGGAVYECGAEPVGGYKLRVRVGEEVVRVGDVGIEGEVRMVWRREEVWGGGGGVYMSKARLWEDGERHKIEIRWRRGKGERELTVLVDDKKVVEVERVVWNFRGSHAIWVEGITVDVLWDVHGWLLGGGSGVFLFRRRNKAHCRLWLEKDGDASDGDGKDFSFLISASRPPLCA